MHNKRTSTKPVLRKKVILSPKYSPEENSREKYREPF